MYKEDVLNKFGDGKYHVTPDTFKIGIHYVLGKEIANRFEGKEVVADVCVGAGLMALCLAERVQKIVAVDINTVHLDLVKENTEVAGLSGKFEFINKDALDKQLFSSAIKIDAIFTDPDWALPENAKGDHVSSIYQMSPPVDKLYENLRYFTENIAIRLPKEVNLRELDNFPKHETESVYLDNKLKFYMVYFGNLVKKIGYTELKSSNSNQ